MATTWKNPVKVATTEKLGSPPKIPGDGKIDGVTLAAGDRVLIKDQGDPKENGIYEVQAGSPLTLARPVGETIEAGDAVLVSERHTNSERWALGANDNPIKVGKTWLPWGRRDPFFNVLDFGADPTGKADSWQAFKDWSIAISNAGGGVGLVPAGTYKIDKVVEKVGSSDGPENFRFEGCKGLWLVGYGATLNLMGDVPLKRIGVHSTDKHMVCPFFIYDCTNVCLEGFEINGNAHPLKWEDGVIEPGGHCVHISNSNHVTIRNMRIHHGWTDGISVKAADSAYPTRLACRNVVIENCEVYANVRCNIAVHETRHIRISDCRLYDSDMGIDIEPNLRIGTEFDKDIMPPGSNRFTIIENCEIYNNEKPLSVDVRYSHVRVQGCFIDNQRDNVQPVILSVPHCALLDCEINTGTGHIDVAITGSDGDNVFTMERCLIRATSGEGLSIIAQVGRIAQALIANCRFICEATSPTIKSFPLIETGHDMLMLTFRDNYTFIPSASYSGSGQKICSTVAVSLAENNVWETDYPGGGENFLGVYYQTDSSVYPKYPHLVRNERFISPDSTGIRAADASDHDNTYPYSQGVDALGGELKGDILKLGEQRVLFAVTPPSSGVFRRGDLIFNTRPLADSHTPMGWVCIKAGTAGAPVNPAVFAPMPNL
jgi:Right handed beta helix region